MEGRARKLVAIAAYVPPGYDARRGRDCLAYISDAVMEVKRRYREPYIIVSGDFNQWDVAAALADFNDIEEVAVGNTRGSVCIDRAFTNFGERVVEGGTVDPLGVDEGEDGAPSDHRVAFVRADLERFEAFEWITYSYMYYNADSERDFGNWIRGYDWSEVLGKEGSNAKALAYQDIITGALTNFFLVITTRRKSTELPWINARIRRLIRRRRAIFKQYGRNAKWRRWKRFIEDLIQKRRDGYFAVCLLYTSPSPRD